MLGTSYLLSSNDSQKLDIAAKEVAEAIHFARLEAMRKEMPYGFSFDSIPMVTQSIQS